MYLEPYRLYDVINVSEKPTLEITVIVFDLDEKLNHSFQHNHFPLKDNSIEDCKDKNDRQVELLYFSISKVKLFFKENPHSTKRKNQLEYLSNALDHFVNWYENNKFQIPDKIPLLEWSKGSFSANKNFSIIKIKNKSYSLRRNQPKIVELLFQNLTDELDGLSYKDLSRELDLTSYGKLSNYFKDSPRVGDLFNYSKRNGKYILKT